MSGDAPELPRRIVRLEPGYDVSDYEWLQANFLHPAKRRLFPSTQVYIGDTLLFETNSYGCKGAEPPPGLPLIGVFGDSVVQGMNIDSFVNHINVAGFASLNCGVEGSTLPYTVDRMLEMHARAPLACAAVHTGWHNLVYDKNSDEYWREQLDRVEGPALIAHFTLAADINSAVIEAGYANLFRPGLYEPWPGVDFADPASLRHFLERVTHFNAFIENYCAEKGRLLIDLREVLTPNKYTDVSMKFWDLIHPRPSAYEPIGRAIAAALAPHLGATFDQPTARRPSTSTPSAAPETGKTYPLW